MTGRTERPHLGEEKGLPVPLLPGLPGTPHTLTPTKHEILCHHSAVPPDILVGDMAARSGSETTFVLLQALQSLPCSYGGHMFPGLLSGRP